MKRHFSTTWSPPQLGQEHCPDILSVAFWHTWQMMQLPRAPLPSKWRGLWVAPKLNAQMWSGQRLHSSCAAVAALSTTDLCNAASFVGLFSTNSSFLSGSIYNVILKICMHDRIWPLFTIQVHHGISQVLGSLFHYKQLSDSPLGLHFQWEAKPFCQERENNYTRAQRVLLHPQPKDPGIAKQYKQTSFTTNILVYKVQPCLSENTLEVSPKILVQNTKPYSRKTGYWFGLEMFDEIFFEWEEMAGILMQSSKSLCFQRYYPSLPSFIILALGV